MRLGDTEYELVWLTPAQVAELPWDELPLRPGSPYGLHVHPLYNLQEDVPAEPPPDDDWVRVWRSLARGLEGKAPVVCLVARVEGQVAGMVRCLPKRLTGARYGSWGQQAHRSDVSDDILWIGAAYVDRQGADDGLDRALLERALAWAREQGYRRAQALGWSDVRTYAQWGQSFPVSAYDALGFRRMHRIDDPLNCLPDMMAGRHDEHVQQLVLAELEAAGLTQEAAEERWIVEIDLD